MIFDEEAREIIEGKNFAYLATSMTDGSPHISPVWIDHDGDTLLVNTVPGESETEECFKGSESRGQHGSGEEPLQAFVHKRKGRRADQAWSIEAHRSVSEKV